MPMNVQPRQKPEPIYAHPNLYQVVNVQNSLRLQRIETSLRNEFAAGGPVSYHRSMSGRSSG